MRSPRERISPEKRSHGLRNGPLRSVLPQILLPLWEGDIVTLEELAPIRPVPDG